MFSKLLMLIGNNEQTVKILDYVEVMALVSIKSVHRQPASV